MKIVRESRLMARVVPVPVQFHPWVKIISGKVVNYDEEEECCCSNIWYE